MMKCYLSLLIAWFCTLSLSAQILDGTPGDSVIIRFNTASVSCYIADTASHPLWQIGLTHKSFFSPDTNGTISLVTDTLNYYSIGANNSVTLKLHLGFNPIVGFWHRYQTDSSHDGGIVEFSVDHGITWQNMKGDCNKDGYSPELGVYTENFYRTTDTLGSGDAAFSGQHANRFSRFQFFHGSLPKGTNWDDCLIGADTTYIRFRFLSDSVADTLAGWMIDSIKIEYDLFAPGGVRPVGSSEKIVPYPNPSYDGTYIFPALNNEHKYRVDLYDAVGRRCLSTPYRHVINICDQPPGLYYYKVSDGVNEFRGLLQYSR